jgi:threonine aldolase
MREAMAGAEVGDDVLDGDPTVRALEEEGARWLGKEGSLFVPSGTMANQVALGAWTRPGDEIIAERGAHILVYEAGAVGALHGLQVVTLAGDAGALDPEDVAAAIRPDFVHCPRTGLVCVEQTHMASGGSVVPLDNLEAVAAVAREATVPVHMDGARLPHAVVASGIPAQRWAACADSVSLCFSKGLGAPVGSLIAGDRAFLERARVVRKRLGGWMRQSGIIAAAARIALDENVNRLEDDHALAGQLAELVGRFAGLSGPVGGPQTNLVPVAVEREDLDAVQLAARLKERGVLVLPLAPSVLRFVTHKDLSRENLDHLERALEEILR